MDVWANRCWDPQCLPEQRLSLVVQSRRAPFYDHSSVPYQVSDVLLPYPWNGRLQNRRWRMGCPIQSVRGRSQTCLDRRHKRDPSESFKEVLDRIMEELFDNDTNIKRLLLKYVVLQLLSDASFCLDRWHQKGGGMKSFRKQKLEKWLWRCLWDNYIAADVVATYQDVLAIQHQ